MPTILNLKIYTKFLQSFLGRKPECVFHSSLRNFNTLLLPSENDDIIDVDDHSDPSSPGGDSIN